MADKQIKSRIITVDSRWYGLTTSIEKNCKLSKIINKDIDYFRKIYEDIIENINSGPYKFKYDYFRYCVYTLQELCDFLIQNEECSELLLKLCNSVGRHKWNYCLDITEQIDVLNYAKELLQNTLDKILLICNNKYSNDIIVDVIDFSFSEHDDYSDFSYYGQLCRDNKNNVVYYKCIDKYREGFNPSYDSIKRIFNDFY